LCDDRILESKSVNNTKDNQIMDFLYKIVLDTGTFYEACAPESFDIKEGDFCIIIKKDKILDYGQIVNNLGSLPPDMEKSELGTIDRKATISDKSKATENQMLAKSAIRTAISHIQRLKLEMKLLSAHYSFDKKMVLFIFTAEGRVDFRQLVKDLAQSLNTKIELRQIGVRDETSIIGGFGVCGQVLCCKKYLRHFESMNVKMAKEQDLSLNPVNISGICDRLKCCLKYEHEGYLEMERDMPRRGSYCECSEGIGKVVDRNLLTQTVKVQIEDSGKCLYCSKSEVRPFYPDKHKSPQYQIKDSKEDDIPSELKALNDK